jgi:hypothetical protein
MATKTSYKMTLAQILEGKKAGRPQTVGIMQMIPLFPQDETHKDRNFAIPTQHMVLGNSPQYGEIRVKNTDATRPLIVPTNSTFVTDASVQDHALAKAGLLGPGEQEKFDNAGCVQATQGGHYASGAYEFQILPATLRRFDRSFAERHQYDKFWNSIGNLNKDIGVSTYDRGHLRILFEKFRKELETFIAEFESLEGQIGAIIVINGRVTGIEIAPSAEYWSAVWDKLVRFCYGPEAILIARKLGKSGFESAVAARPQMDIEKCNTLEDIQAELDDLRRREAEQAKSYIFGDLDLVLQMNPDKTVNVTDSDSGALSYVLASTFDDYVGQVILDDDYAVYASLVNQTAAPKRPQRAQFNFGN